MPKDRGRQGLGFLVFWVSVLLMILAALARTAMNVTKFRRNFQDEMALRLDLEEKMVRMERERAALLSQLKSLKDEIAKNRDEVGSLKSELLRAEEAKTSLEDQLKKAAAPPTPESR